jgi:Tfp pilus assembly protein PilO
MKIQNREKMLALLAIAAVVILATDQFVVEPLIKLWKERSQKIVDLTKKINQATVLVARKKEILDRWDTMKSQMLAGDVSRSENEVIKAVDRWTQQSRISMTSLKPQWKQNADDYRTLECRADGAGDLQALARFLYEVEKDPMALKVEDLEITSRDEEGRQLSIALRVSALQLNPE